MIATSGRNRPVEIAQRHRAALACIDKVRAWRDSAHRAASPSGALTHIASALTQEDTRDQVWIVDADRIAEPSPSRSTKRKQASEARTGPFPSAVATWFRTTPSYERPLLYLLHSPTLRGVLAAAVEATGIRLPSEGDVAGRGIFLNDATLSSPDRQRRVRPELPLWLAAQPAWLPYDPASAQELQALLCAALDALYVRGESGFCYLSAHDVPSAATSPLSPQEACDAFRGMYRLRALADTHPPYAIRLCGAGSALASVLEAARWLQLDWGVACEVWSCPSYTRLAREAAEVEHRALRGIDAPAQEAHLTRCLARGHAPVLAVTGYARHIANQIGAFVPARFLALGSDDRDGGEGSGKDVTAGHVPGVRWIVLNALRLLVEDGALPRARIADATRRYGLA
ncbi:Pyruvate dehydrogenase E1 component [Pandoraea fibrosis]|uniref:Pyruvate dehydrogenase E1 component n=1 Tax=Pandoraea fibrosis TaxID=1891094 RepID=A0A5E4URL6_9BURK|nr:Pyruvate dehydrogenase E1 component [Pandoraea fibrosis]